VVTRGLAALVALAACSDDAAVVAPAVDAPALGSDADPFADLDALELSVALAGDDDDLASARFARGERVELTGVPYSDDLVVHLTGSAGSVDVAYGRTCGFDLRRDLPLPVPHLFFARTVKWAQAPVPPAAERRGGWALATPDGGAVFGGGTSADATAVTAVDGFDPRAGAFRGAGAVVARVGATAALLGDGRVVVVGGAGALAPLDFVELIDPSAGGRVERVEDTAGLVGRRELTATTLADGGVLVVGGRDGAGAVSGAIVELRAAGAAVELRRIRVALAAPRAEHTTTRLSDDLGASLLVAGGVGVDGAPVAAAEVYRPLRESLSPASASMVVARRGHRAVRMPDGSVLVMGGVDAAGAAVRRMELFSIDAGFADVGELPAGAGAVDAAVTVLPDGRVLLTGGRAEPGGAALDTAFIARLDPLDGSVDVVATDRLDRPRAGHQAARLCDGSVLVVGGADGPAPAERYNPPPLGRR
jgi:hypothetical protein